MMDLVKVRKIYDKWAPFYNPTHQWSLPKRRHARVLLNIQPGDRVLDLACGTGVNFQHLRELAGPKGQIIGVDLSPRMLDVARRLIEKREWKNVEVKEADAAGLPFPDGYFNKVICSYALNIVPEYERAIQEVKRVLKSGGTFVSLEVRSGHSMPKWLAPICAVDLSHETLNAIKRIFKTVGTRSYWSGMVFIAVAQKSELDG